MIRAKLLLGLVSLIVIGSLCGCTHTVKIYPIEKTDIFFIPKGAKITYNSTEIVTEKQGRFLSDYYINEIVDAKVEE